MKIKDIHAREILDSRSNPTVEVEMTLSSGIKVRASVPSGASTGSKEALELRDEDPKRYHGKGVLKAVNNVNKIIAPKLIGMKLDQEKIDNMLLEMDGTYNKEVLGANAILGVSLCVLKALAASQKKELYEYVGSSKNLPIPMINVINGGAHADNNLDIQEFMIVPLQDTEEKRVMAASEVFITLKKMLKDDGHATGVGDEGGFAPNLKNNEECFSYLVRAIEKSGYRPGKDIALAIDAAASEFYDKKTKKYTLDNKKYTAKELTKYYLSLIEKYPIISIEDPYDEDDVKSFAELTEKCGDKIMIVGDDFFVSQAKYLEIGIEENAANAILLKANQVGTITEFLETIDLARTAGYKMIISHRSGETEDTFIADLAVGLNIPYIKTGSVSRGERVAKYNRLTYIEQRINNK